MGKMNEIDLEIRECKKDILKILLVLIVMIIIQIIHTCRLIKIENRLDQQMNYIHTLEADVNNLKECNYEEV